ncbi:ArsR/SmtB family transcription factor [Nonomuraea sediminis]|uniref:ArsR/SmtB family transcription factor n=1 Tax=Nonomuraea sediminis TaxID=2835864 RepID=UPI001BDC6FB7|nr:DUF5937 family protein [Nonomuraea sediminis]
MPAFLLPSSPAEQPRFEPTLDDELDLLAATPLDRIRAELLPRSGAGGSLPRVAQELLDGQSRALRRMVQVVRDVFKSCMSDDWPDIRRRLHRDLNHRAHVMMVNGTGAVLQTLHPTITWESGHLLYTVPDQPPVGSTANQGFVLKPCAFGSSSIHPVTAPGHPPVLIYPCREDGADRLGRGGGDSLSVLLGAGRARALRAIDGGCSTAELARRLYVGPPTASAHAVVLRSAGLITTERDGQRVRHEVTLLGSGLLAANPGGNSMDS